MSSWRQQALIEAPVETVWELVGDPNRHPEWWPDVLEVKGVPKITQDATYRQVTRTRGGSIETTFSVEEVDELRTIKLRCTDTGTYAHWLLTEARDSTFADLELGIEPTSLRYRVFDGMLGKRYFRDWAQRAVDGLRDAAQRPAKAAGADRS
jgi:uncharacterized protein YndB with AHSA1/START domain